MRGVGPLIRAIALIVIVLTVFATLFVCHTQNTSGGYSAVCKVSNKTKVWVSKNFCKYETADELLNGLVAFAISNFIYDDDGYLLIQTANLDRFIFDDYFHGVCFEFSVFAKTVALLWADEKAVDMKAYLCNVWYNDQVGKRVGHSYNFFEYDGRTICLDLTADITAHRTGDPDAVWGALDIDMTKEEFNRKLYNSDHTTFI